MITSNEKLKTVNKKIDIEGEKNINMSIQKQLFQEFEYITYFQNSSYDYKQ